MFARPEARGLGLGRGLVAVALERAKVLGHSRVVLDTDLANMPAAAPLYKSFGFQEYGERIGSIAFFELFLPASPVPQKAAPAVTDAH